jgi:hypothetical protein
MRSVRLEKYIVIKNIQILDYSRLSDFREYGPLNTDPIEVDLLAGQSRSCRACASHLREVPNVFETNCGYPAAILFCAQCGWWCQYSVGSNLDGFFEFERIPAALRQYRVSDIDVPVAALRRELENSSALLLDLNPTRMEQLVGSILSDFMDCEVVHTGRTSDGGIDLLLLDGDTPYVVQVKRRLNQGQGEAVGSVREFLAATLLAGYQRGIYVTTATHFTSAANDAAAVAKSRGLVEKLHLIDRDRFLRLLTLVSTKTLAPWQTYYCEEEGCDLDRIFVSFHGENSHERHGRDDLWDSDLLGGRRSR